MKKVLFLIGCVIITASLFSCREGGVSYENQTIIDSLLYKWEYETDSIISDIRIIDSSNVYFLNGDTHPCNEYYFIKNEYIRERNNLMRPTLPVLIRALDTILIIENYHVESKTIDIYGNKTVYSYRINSIDHLPYLVSIKYADVSEVIKLVEKKFYKCYSHFLIGDLTCITLITKQEKKQKLEILALTINDVQS